MPDHIRQCINPPSVTTVAPLSLAVRLDDTVHLSGLVGKVPETGKLSGGVKEQTHQILKNMGVVLQAAGCSYENVIKTTVLLTDIKDFTTVNEIYKQYFKTNYPARTAFQVVALPLGALVEIEAFAVLGTVADVK